MLIRDLNVWVGNSEVARVVDKPGMHRLNENNDQHSEKKGIIFSLRLFTGKPGRMRGLSRRV